MDFTTTLPTDDGPRAVQLFDGIGGGSRVTLMVVLGQQHEDVFNWAGERCAEFSGARQACWIPNPGLADLETRVATIRNGSDDVILAVFGLDGEVRKRMTRAEITDILDVELAFTS